MRREPSAEASRSCGMTIGELARRSGASIKAVRGYEGMGLLYGLGRTESNYRLFDESTLWCLQVIRILRSLGLTLKEIRSVSAIYGQRRGEPIGPHLREKLDSALDRIEGRMAELQEVRRRILGFRAGHASALAGQAELELYAADPRRHPIEAVS